MFAHIAAIAFLLPALVSAVAIPDPQGAPGMGSNPWGVSCPQGCRTQASWAAQYPAKHVVAVCIDGGNNKFYYVNGQGASDKWAAAGIACAGRQGCPEAIINSLPNL